MINKKKKSEKRSKPEIKIEKIEKSFFYRNLSASWDYIKESRNYILSAIELFLLFCIIGLLIEPPKEFLDYLREFLKTLVDRTSGLNALQLIGFIFNNNIFASFVGLFVGVILGIFPILSACFNGYVLGYISQLSIQNGEAISLWKIFPHGIFELPAVFISLGLGIKLGMFIFSKDAGKEFLRRLKLSIKTFLFVVLPLLIIAAIIEGILIRFLV